MSDINRRIEAFVDLGLFLSQFSADNTKKDDTVLHNALFYDAFQHQIKLTQEQNGWFTRDNIHFAISQWAALLTQEKINAWVTNYNLDIPQCKNVAIVMAGNIPLVGFHDFLCVLIAGHRVIVKQSSNDKHLLPLLAKYLEYSNSEFKGNILFTEAKLENFDAVIATGSNNTARYFEYYFKDKPNIIRKNRNSVAVLKGNETQEQLHALGEDIFRYFGLGCRNVSKLLVPKGYDFDIFFNAMYAYKNIIEIKKYQNNYDYNKAVYLMSQFKILDNGFLTLKEEKEYGSPIATLFYEFYEDVAHLKEILQTDKEKIQCVVGEGASPTEIEFGQTQSPKLEDYADNIDTVDFLLKI